MKKSWLKNERRLDADAVPRRLLEARNHLNVIKVLPGESKMTRDIKDVLVTTLGSCVSACIRDPRTGIGGMNHFMLPLSRDEFGTWGGVSRSLRYGNHAMESLINEIIRTGCPRQELEIKVFGGGNVMKGKTDIGHNNARFVLAYLKNEGLAVTAADLGGQHARRIYYSPADGSVKRLLLRRSGDDMEVRRLESRYEQEISREEIVDGDIELFD